MPTATFTKTGSKASVPAKLEKDVFSVAIPNHELLKQAYVAYLANGRINLAKTKKRGEVRGGGRKPWRQKGTGNARVGSIRSPLWRSGGVTFGPTGEENYSKKLNLSAKRQALRQALTASQENISIIENIAISDGKTKSASAILKKIDVSRNILVVTDSKTPELVRSFRNLKDVKLVSAQYLNVYDILNADSIVITKPALDVIHAWLGKGATK